jgi:carboxylesterase type B
VVPRRRVRDRHRSWDNLGSPGTEILVGEITEARRTLARRMGDVWTAFAAGAPDPSPTDMAAWPSYEPGRRATMWLTADGVRIIDDPFGPERRWWDGLDAGLGFDPGFRD